jgi:hypothetical protein
VSVPAGPDAGPHAAYQQGAAQRTAQAAHAARLEETIARVRLVVALTVIPLWWAAATGRLSSAWVLVPIVVFGGLVIGHARVRRQRREAERRAAFHARGLARLDGRWSGTGRIGTRFLDPHHPYADDLDLFGAGSLYELLCAARTPMGEETLAGWLLAPAELASARARQVAVQEMAPRLQLREDLAVLGERVADLVRPDAFLALTAPVRPPPTTLRLGVASLSIVTLALVGAWGLGFVPPEVAVGALAIQSAVRWRLSPRVRDADRAVAGHGPDLSLLAAVLKRFEDEALAAPLLAELRGNLLRGGISPSRAVASLRGRVELFDSRRNQFFKPFALLTMWDVQLALSIEAWRARHGASVGPWLTTVGQLEALGSLAGFAHDRPGHVYPAFDESQTRFEAQGLGHPLMPEATCVRNDVELGGAVRVLIVSGSNMSGKSTLLRTVGVNTVLALAGAPVCAARLTTSRLSIGATLRIRDSLQEGTSRFYAELVRLRDLVRIAEGPIPLLFLLDEILHGTNSHDRRLGAAAVVSGLVERGAIGLVTTHDLALSEVAGDPAVGAANVHFEDRLEDGRMVFDYRMRPGVVQTSNALALMRTLGLLPGDSAGSDRPQ